MSQNNSLQGLGNLVKSYTTGLHEVGESSFRRYVPSTSEELYGSEKFKNLGKKSKIKSSASVPQENNVKYNPYARGQQIPVSELINSQLPVSTIASQESRTRPLVSNPIISPNYTNVPVNFNRQSHVKPPNQYQEAYNLFCLEDQMNLMARQAYQQGWISNYACKSIYNRGLDKVSRLYQKGHLPREYYDNMVNYGKFYRMLRKHDPRI